jgi:hypothetical protein
MVNLGISHLPKNRGAEDIGKISKFNNQIPGKIQASIFKIQG